MYYIVVSIFNYPYITPIYHIGFDYSSCIREVLKIHTFPKKEFRVEQARSLDSCLGSDGV